MEQNTLKNRNKGAEMCAVIRDGRPPLCLISELCVELHKPCLGPVFAEQKRYREHDPHLQSALDETYDYMTKHLDPILSRAIEEVLLYQPDQTADFLAHFLRGTLNPKKYTYVVSLVHSFDVLKRSNRPG